MKVLFFPSDKGGGFGHISRCLVLAREARRRGHECSFVLSDGKYVKHIMKDFPVLEVKRYKNWKYFFLPAIKRVLSNKEPEKVPIFTGFSTLDYQVVRDGFLDTSIVEYVLGQYIDILNASGADLIIGDTNLLAQLAARKAGLPIVQIVRFASHPNTQSIVWWNEPSAETKPPRSADLFNPLLAKLGLEPIMAARDLLQGDLYIVPSIPELEPIAVDQKTEYVGHLSVSGEQKTPVWLRGIDEDLPLIYVTIGGGAGPVGNKMFFETVAEAFSEKSLEVVVSTSEKFSERDLPSLPKNIRMFRWVPGELLISKSHAVVFHGGYGTMMECVAYGKPTVVIPFQTEQEGNGRRLEQLGCSLVLKLSRERPRCIEGNWRYGRFTLSLQNTYDLTSDELHACVERVLNNREYKDNALVLKSRIEEYGGPVLAMDLIEKRWG